MQLRDVLRRQLSDAREVLAYTREFIESRFAPASVEQLQGKVQSQLKNLSRAVRLRQLHPVQLRALQTRVGIF